MLLFSLNVVSAQSQFCANKPNHPMCKINNEWDPGEGNPNVPISGPYKLIGILTIGALLGIVPILKENENKIEKT